MFNWTDLACVFEASGKFYLWYSVGLDVVENTSPTTIDEIIQTMKEKEDGAVKAKRVL